MQIAGMILSLTVYIAQAGVNKRRITDETSNQHVIPFLFDTSYTLHDL